MDQLSNWLILNQLEKYQKVLIENDITSLELLSELTEDDIKELGFSLGERKRFAIGIKTIGDKAISETDGLLLSRLPYVIAYPLQQTLLEKNAPQRLNYFRDTFLNYLKYLGLLTASEFFNSPFKERKMVDLFLQNLAQPSFGSWNAFTRACLCYLKTQNHTFFCPDLVKYYETVESGKKRKMYKGEIEVVDSYNGGETRYIKQEDTGIGMLINFRNRYLGHGLTLDAATSEKIWNDYFPIFRALLDQLTFSEKFPMLKQEAKVYYSLQGIEITPFIINAAIDSNVAIYNRDKNTSMPIIPFFIIPGELAIERDEKANIMSYESNNGKTITFFSPEGITKQTSGKILERLNLLLRDKQKEIPFTPELFTKEIFLERIAEENKLMLKSLLNEKKVIEGIYQHREEMEIKLREWIGARANIFFIAAEAGSGKTNLLVEMQRQYAERNLVSLFVRASRMEKPSLKEELGYQLNMDTSLDIAHYSALAGTQAEPTFIFIDGLNEAIDADAIWLEILEISTAFEPGSLKFIISNRANSKADLGRYVVSERQMQYLYGENKDHEKGLGAYAFWLTPLDMKEMEGAWVSYIAKDKTRFKPLFSFNDIASFDRGLYLQINNPLVLRIFLETYKGKNLPKKGTKHLHVWKDWFATFSNEEQNFLCLLADAVWEQGENELLLDKVLNTEKLKSYFLTDSISAPYHRLLNLGWISRYVKDLTVYVSFTVEGLLLYLLGVKLNQQNPIPTTEAIDEILAKGTKLQKSAIESFLCEQALEGEIDLIAQLIDEGEEKLELCVIPLLNFLKSQGVENTIEKLLENPTKNDWNALLELDGKLLEFQLHILRKEFLIAIISYNSLSHKDAFKLGITAITVIDKKEAMELMSKIDTTQSFLYEDADLLDLLGLCEIRFGEYDKALVFYEKCLEIKLKTLGSEHTSVGILYSNIGGIWEAKGEYDKALSYHGKGLVILLKTLGEENSNIASIYHNFGDVWNKKDNYDKALISYEKCLVIFLKTIGGEHLHVGATYSGIGNTWFSKGEYEKALLYYRKSLIIDFKTVGGEHPNVATTYNNIGRVLDTMGEYDNALDNYAKCLAIRLKTLGEEHPDLGSIYCSIGFTWYNSGEYDKALEYFQKSLAIELKTFGGEHPDLATSFNNIGSVLDEKGEYDKALEYYQKSLAISFKSFGDEHPTVATSYNNIGVLWYKQSEYEKALTYSQKCLAIRLMTLREEHPDLGTIYKNIGRIWYSKSNYDLSLEYYEKGLALELKTFGENHIKVADTYNNIGCVYQLNGEFDKALICYENCLAIQLKTFDENYPDIALTHNNIGSILKILNRYTDAILYFEKAFFILKKGGFSLSIAQSYEAINKPTKALDYYIQSAEIRKVDIGLENEATKEAIVNALRLAKELGKDGELPEWMRIADE